jgi:hypothetical protein
MPGGSKTGPAKSGKKENSMKKQTLMFASLCLVLGLAVIPVVAQAGGVQVKVPFNFVVSGKTLPAGEYTMIAASHQVKLQDARGRMISLVLANDVAGRSAGANGEIIFHCYGEHCFLSEVWSPAQDYGRQLLTSRTEAELAKEEKGRYFAVLGEKPQK